MPIFSSSSKNRICGIDFTQGDVEVTDEQTIYDLMNNYQFGNDLSIVDEVQETEEVEEIASPPVPELAEVKETAKKPKPTTKRRSGRKVK